MPKGFSLSALSSPRQKISWANRWCAEGINCFSALWPSIDGSKQLFTPITSSDGLKEQIKQQVSPLKSIEGCTTRHALLKNPLFFARVFRRRIKPDQVIEYLKKYDKEHNLVATYSDLEKASQLFGTAQVLMNMLGSSFKYHNLLVQLSLLYPITDAYIDNLSIGKKNKMALCDSIDTFIRNSIKNKKNDLEISKPYQTIMPKRLRNLLKAIDVDSKLFKNEKIWKTLLELNDCQRQSIMQQEPYSGRLSQQELFNLSYKKGAVTFKAIILLVQPNISPKELELCQTFGGLAQLFDDVVDLAEDARSGILTFAMLFTMEEDLKRAQLQANHAYLTSYQEIYQKASKTLRFSRSINAYLSLLVYQLGVLMNEFKTKHPYLSKIITDEVFHSIFNKMDQLISLSPEEPYYAQFTGTV